MSERKYIQHYHSLTSGNVPAAEDLLVGEIAINVADGKIYTKNENNEVITLNEKQDLIVPIRYHELVALRNEDKLIPGVKYRIIDYECTTSDPETQSAGHRFDIIVTALNKNTLSEEASAIQNEYSYNIENEFIVDGGSRLFILENEVHALTEISRSDFTVFFKNNDNMWVMTTGVADGTVFPKYSSLPSSVNVTLTHCVYDEFCQMTELWSETVTVAPFEPIVGTYLGTGFFADNCCVQCAAFKVVDGEYTEFIFCSLGETNGEIFITDDFTCVTKTIAPCTDFDNSDLNAWKINYCLDNNIYRFNWAVPDMINGWALDPYYNLYKIDVSDNNVALQTNILWELDGKSYYFWDSLNDTKYLTEYKTPYSGGEIYTFDENTETISTTALTINAVEKWNAYGPTKDFSGSNVAYYFCKLNPQIGDTIYEINVSGRDEYYTFGIYSTTTVESVESNGKGVIYRMIDEFGNDCPYDFKNLLYFNGDGQTVFTFSNQLTNGTFLDASVNRYGTGKVARNNKIESVFSALSYNNASNTFYTFSLPRNVLINPGHNNRFYNSRYNYIYNASDCEFINSNKNVINAHSYSGINFSNNNLVFKNSDQNLTNCAFTNVSFIACINNSINASSLWRPGNYEFKSIRYSEITVPDNSYDSSNVLTISDNSSGEVKIYNVADLIA